MKTFHHPNLEDVSLPTVMQALSDPNRVLIVKTMKEAKGRKFSCKEFELGISKSTRSHHFEVLRQAGLMKTNSEGTKNLSFLREQEVNKRFPGLLNLIAAED